MATETLPAEAAVKAAKDARRAMLLTMFAVAVAILVLGIDHTIKRAIIAEAQDVRKIFAQFKEGTDGLAAAIQAGASDSAADSAGDPGSGDLADDAGIRPAASGNASGPKPARASRAGGGKPRP